VYGTRMLKKIGRKYLHDSNIGKEKKKTRGEGESPQSTLQVLVPSHVSQETTC
jgi:hypothetical protein